MNYGREKRMSAVTILATGVETPSVFFWVQ